MVEFVTPYATPMDRDYGKGSITDSSTNDAGLGIGDIGMSVPFGIAAPNVQGLDAKMRTGLKHVEIQFPGAGKGRGQAQTPGIYGKLQRQAIAELAKSRGINFSIHASYGIMGVSGWNNERGGFSKEHKKFAIDEINRAVEFAADVTQGAPITVHTGEFRRSLGDQSWAKDENGRQIFKQAASEDSEEAIVRIVDSRNGRVIDARNKNEKYVIPIWNIHQGGSYTDRNGNLVRDGDYIDYVGDKVDVSERVPYYNESKGEFEMKSVSWDYFEKEAEKINRREGTNYRAEEVLVRSLIEKKRSQADGFARYYLRGFDNSRELLNKVSDAERIRERIDISRSDEEKERLRGEIMKLGLKGEIENVILHGEKEKARDVLEKLKMEAKRELTHSEELAAAQFREAREWDETKKYAETADKFAKKQAFDSWAQTAVKAWQLTKAKKLENPLFIAIEHIFPEDYGGHPDELKEIIHGTREIFVKELKKYGVKDDKEAKELARKHIKAHIDTGHLNIWRKYWVNDPKKTPEENSRNFDDWIVKKTEELAEDDMVGSVHLDDNYGYYDEHLSPGEGTTPINRMIKALKKHGYKGPLVVEPGADATTDVSDFHGVMKTWKLFGSEIYGGGVGRGVPGRNRKWSDVQYGYFGQAEPPYFVFGGYSPSNEWRFWSETPLE